MLTIAFVGHKGGFDGAPQCLYLLLKHVDRSRIEPLVVCPEEDLFYRNVLQAGLGACVLQKFPHGTLPGVAARGIKLVWRLRYIVSLARLLRARSVDGVYVNTVQNSSGVLAARVAGLPAIAHIHELERRFEQVGRLRTGIVLRGAGGFIAVSDATRDLLLKRGVPPDKIVVIQNGVDLRRFDPDRLGPVEQLRRDLRIQPGSTICTVASLQELKGIHVLVEAMPSILAAHPSARLLVIGDTAPGAAADYLERLVSRCHTLGVSDRVDFLGFKDDVERYMALADVVAIPSFEEAFPRVAIEAMALGKAVVATRVGGLPEIVDDGVTGLLVPPNDARALAEAVSDLLGAPERLARMGAAGRERAQARYDAHVYAARIQGYIESFLPEARSHG